MRIDDAECTKSTPEADVLMARFTEIQVQLESKADDIQRAIVRLSGDQLTESEREPCPSKPGLMGRLEDSASDLEIVAGRYQALAGRLNELV